MSDSSEKTRFINARRRGFLQGAAVAGGAVAAGSAVASTADIAAEEPLTTGKQTKGYELTDHIRKYYKRARF